MGYSTDFFGKFEVSPPLSEEHKQFLFDFAETRHMRREIEGYGEEGEFYVDSLDIPHKILSQNEPPKTQPGLWCGWVPTEDGTGIEWDGAEKFYHYDDWLQYLIDNFLVPWGHEVSGDVKFQGEEHSDVGYISVEDNKVKIYPIFK